MTQFPDVSAHPLNLPDGPELFFAGPPLGKGPLPAIFYFSLSARESLTLPPFNQPVAALIDRPIRIFSATLPVHGQGEPNETAMGRWAAANPRVFETFYKQLIDAIEKLIADEVIQEGTVGLAGLSRGSWIALHLAARTSAAQNILCFAPLTDIFYLKEFEGLDIPTYKLAPYHKILAKKAIRIFMGNRDTRVGTDTAFNFLYALTESAYQQGIRSPRMEMVISPSVGKDGHGTLPHIFKEGAEWLYGRISVQPPESMEWIS